MANITFKGNPVSTNGELPKVGSQAPDFSLVAADLSEKSLADFKGQTKILTINPSYDTGVCQATARAFNKQAAGKEGAVVLAISADLPFAQKRFCGAEGIEGVAKEEVVVAERDARRDAQRWAVVFEMHCRHLHVIAPTERVVELSLKLALPRLERFERSAQLSELGGLGSCACAGRTALAGGRDWTRAIGQLAALWRAGAGGRDGLLPRRDGRSRRRHGPRGTRELVGLSGGAEGQRQRERETHHAGRSEGELHALATFSRVPARRLLTS